jgi:hypothetical protein
MVIMVVIYQRRATVLMSLRCPFGRMDVGIKEAFRDLAARVIIAKCLTTEEVVAMVTYYVSLNLFAWSRYFLYQAICYNISIYMILKDIIMIH